jgi:butyryl-CoA dehydrogenase
MASLGLMGMIIDQKYGGAGTDTISYAIAVEEISKYCATTGVIMSVNNSLVCYPLQRFGTEEQKKKYLVELASGRKIGAFCLTEPEAGSDAASIQTYAKKENDFYILNGTKNFITNAGPADIYIVFATIAKEKKHKGLCAFIVEKNQPGFTMSEPERKLGIHGSETRQLFFEDCKVNKENLLGNIGDGFKIAMITLDCGRIGIAAQAVGIAQACLDASIKYSKEREQFNEKICNFQAIQWFIVDMATRINAARLLTYYAAYLKDCNLPYSKEAAMAKLFASETAMQSAILAVQIHGGIGYTEELPVERYFRDAKITEIYEGTSEIMRWVIASHSLELK